MKTIHHNDTLVVYLKHPNDWKIVQQYGIYRIRSWIKHPPEILENRSVEKIAFYLPSIFGKKKYSIRHYADVRKISIAPRHQCCPDEPRNKKSDWDYYKIEIETPQELKEPIFHFRAAKKKMSRREMILFPTDFERLETALEFNFLFNNSHLEAQMWKTLLDHNIYPEREWPVKIDKNQHYYLDFAVFCNDGYFCIEVDGKQHLEKQQVLYDNHRTNNTNLQGWKTFRFYEKDLQPSTIQDTIEKIRTAIKRRHGLDNSGGLFPTAVKNLSKTSQLSLFLDEQIDFLNLRKLVKERFER
jgi:very-short-patch-repair endonuclease